MTLRELSQREIHRAHNQALRAIGQDEIDEMPGWNAEDEGLL